MDYVALDWETANRYPGGGCAVALARFDGEGNLKDRMYSLLSPRIPYFDPWMTKIHHLRAEDCLQGPTFEEYWPLMRSFIGDDLVCAHNAAFDMGVLKEALLAYGIETRPIDYVCTCVLSRRLWPGLRDHRLDTVADALGLGKFRHHQALDDALVCGKIFKKECGDALLGDWDVLARYLFHKGYLPKKMVAESVEQF